MAKSTISLKAAIASKSFNNMYTAPAGRFYGRVVKQSEMPLMFGKKIGKQKIYISAINGPSLPPKPLEKRCRAFCCAELPLIVTPVWGEKRKIIYRKICISVINGPSLPPKPSQTPSKLSQFLLTKVAMAAQECASVTVSRSSHYRPPHLYSQMEFGTNLTPLNRLQCRR